MDAVPVTLGQEFGGYAAQVRQGRDRVADTTKRLGQIPLGGTATGTGLNTHPEFAAARARAACRPTPACRSSAPADPFEAQGTRDALVEVSGALKVVAVSLTKIANDIALLGSGPRAGLAEIFLPELQKGSSIMPGKVNPVIPEVVHPGRRPGDRQRRGDHDRRPAGQLRAQRAHAADRAQPARLDPAAHHHVAPVRRQVRRRASSRTSRACRSHAEATLAVATALNPYIGYDKATAIVKDATASGRQLREVAREHGVEESVLDEALDLRVIAAGSSAK